jgi:hypothetical protein
MYFLSMAQQPPVGQALLIVEASRSRTDSPHSVRLFWTTDQPDAKTSTNNIQYAQERDIHALGGIRTHNPIKRAATDPGLKRRPLEAANKYIYDYYVYYEPGSVVGIATGYRLGGPGIESRWVEIFRTCPDRHWGPSTLLYNGYRVFPGGKERPGRDADPSPLLVPWSRKGRAIPLLPL